MWKVYLLKLLKCSAPNVPSLFFIVSTSRHSTPFSGLLFSTLIKILTLSQKENITWSYILLPICFMITRLSTIICQIWYVEPYIFRVILVFWQNVVCNIISQGPSSLQCLVLDNHEISTFTLCLDLLRIFPPLFLMFTGYCNFEKQPPRGVL